jgi:hypothetical protein
VAAWPVTPRSQLRDSAGFAPASLRREALQLRTVCPRYDVTGAAPRPTSRVLPGGTATGAKGDDLPEPSDLRPRRPRGRRRGTVHPCGSRRCRRCQGGGTSSGSCAPSHDRQVVAERRLRGPLQPALVALEHARSAVVRVRCRCVVGVVGGRPTAPRLASPRGRCARVRGADARRRLGERRRLRERRHQGDQALACLLACLWLLHADEVVRFYRTACRTCGRRPGAAESRVS